MLLIENLTKCYSSFKVVNIEKLHIPEGKFSCFLGQNGAGKTTTIKMITGLLKPTSGNIYINGYNITKEPELAKTYIGYIADKPMIYEKLTGREFVVFMANLYGIRTSIQLEKEIDEILKTFELYESANNLIQTYSQGMKQKIAIAGALIHKPKLLILDEPTNGLDPQGAKVLKEYLKEYVNKGNTVLMSTHILEIAEKICDNMIIIKKGNIVFNGIIDELKILKGYKELEQIFFEISK